MHSTDGVTPGVQFFHNGDYRGELRITAPSTLVEVHPKTAYREASVTVTISMEDIKQVVAAQIREYRIWLLEQMDADDLLGL